jgi:restriction system protein
MGTHEVNLAGWQQRKTEFNQVQEEANRQILNKKSQYFAKDSDAVADYSEMVLANSQYASSFPQEWDLEFKADSGSLLIEYQLPKPSTVPTARAFRYVAAKDVIEEQSLSESFRNSLYDEVLYQIALRTIHEIFEADAAEAHRCCQFQWMGQRHQSCHRSRSQHMRHERTSHEGGVSSDQPRQRRS